MWLWFSPSQRCTIICSCRRYDPSSGGWDRQLFYLCKRCNKPSVSCYGRQPACTVDAAKRRSVNAITALMIEAASISRWTTVRLQGAATQRTAIFVIAVMTTWNLTSVLCCLAMDDLIFLIWMLIWGESWTKYLDTYKAWTWAKQQAPSPDPYLLSC
jgi:hypothetical protein